VPVEGGHGMLHMNRHTRHRTAMMQA
jgi:hypothetical protein